MEHSTQEKNLHRLFELGVALKGVNAIIELGVGVLLFFVNIGEILQALVESQLIDDPDGFLARHGALIMGVVSPHAQYASALYLIAHGVIKIVLVYGLLRDKMWAYPSALAVLSLFISYQTITFAHTHSIALLLITIFDISLAWLIYHEYRRHAKQLRE